MNNIDRISIFARTALMHNGLTPVYFDVLVPTEATPEQSAYLKETETYAGIDIKGRLIYCSGINDISKVEARLVGKRIGQAYVRILKKMSYTGFNMLDDLAKEIREGIDTRHSYPFYFIYMNTIFSPSIYTVEDTIQILAGTLRSIIVTTNTITGIKDSLYVETLQYRGESISIADGIISILSNHIKETEITFNCIDKNAFVNGMILPGILRGKEETRVFLEVAISNDQLEYDGQEITPALGKLRSLGIIGDMFIYNRSNYQYVNLETGRLVEFTNRQGLQAIYDAKSKGLDYDILLSIIVGKRAPDLSNNVKFPINEAWLTTSPLHWERVFYRNNADD